MTVRREEAVLELAKWVFRDLEKLHRDLGIPAPTEAQSLKTGALAGARARAVADKLGVNADLRAEHYLTLTAQEAYVANAINSYVEVREALASPTPTGD